MRLIVAYPRRHPWAGSHIAARSAIVHREPDDGADHAVCHYEGAVHGGETGFRDKILRASGRLSTGYPTVARMRLPLDGLAPGAVWDVERLAIVETIDAAGLAAWAGEAFERFAGRRLEPGERRLADVEEAFGHSGYRPLSHGPENGVFWFQTFAGQAMKTPVASTNDRVTIYDWDDVAIPPAVKARMTAHVGKVG